MKRPQNAVEIEYWICRIYKDIEIDQTKEHAHASPSQISNHIMFQRMTSQFGESLPDDNAQLEATVSTGNHIDHHIFSPHEFREDINAQFYQGSSIIKRQ